MTVKFIPGCARVPAIISINNVQVGPNSFLLFQAGWWQGFPQDTPHKFPLHSPSQFMTVDIRRTAGELPFFGRRALECFWIAVPFAASASKVYGGDYDGDIGFQDGLYGARRSFGFICFDANMCCSCRAGAHQGNVRRWKRPGGSGLILRFLSDCGLDLPSCVGHPGPGS